MAIYNITMQKYADQRIRLNVPINGKNIPLALHLTYNFRGKFWRMDIENGKTGEILLANVPLLRRNTNYYNLLEQFEHLGVGRAYIKALFDTTDTDSPDYKTFINQFVLMWGDYDDRGI